MGTLAKKNVFDCSKQPLLTATLWNQGTNLANCKYDWNIQFLICFYHTNFGRIFIFWPIQNYIIEKLILFSKLCFQPKFNKTKFLLTNVFIVKIVLICFSCCVWFDHKLCSDAKQTVASNIYTREICDLCHCICSSSTKQITTTKIHKKQ